MVLSMSKNFQGSVLKVQFIINIRLIKLLSSEAETLQGINNY
jgi:hypothetical protein